jgi:hypothetical protein
MKLTDSMHPFTVKVRTSPIRRNAGTNSLRAHRALLVHLRMAVSAGNVHAQGSGPSPKNIPWYASITM